MAIDQDCKLDVPGLPTFTDQCLDTQIDDMQCYIVVQIDDTLTTLLDDIDNSTRLLDGAPPNWSAYVRDYLDEHLPHICRVVDYNIPLTQ
ncbi:hypothetical protein TNCV_4639121 [Trichonephila clavipes]|nr:hypothetical protein TNCV_4639121 [Trichonephila clavipes]